MSEEINSTEKEHGNIMQTLTIVALVIALGAMAFVQVSMKHEQERTNRAITDLSDKQQSRIEGMEQRTSMLEQDNATLHADGATVNSAVKDTQHRLSITAKATDK